jgi:hypothetical protein
MRRQMALLISFLIPVLVITSCSFGKTTPAPPTNATTPTLVPANTVLTSQSNELIDAALQAGQIDAQTALVYKLYAQFTDSRLPAIYQGGVNLATDSHILDEVQAEYPNLSPENQARFIVFDADDGPQFE